MRSISRKDQSPIESIPKSIAWYLVGFADGEGSFNVSFKRQADVTLGWKAAPSFNISQRDDSICKLFQRVLGVGTLRYRRDGVCYYEVRSVADLVEKIIPFFTSFPLRSWKRHDFRVFARIVRFMSRGSHRSRKGLEVILRLRNHMNRGGNRKIADQAIRTSLRTLKSSETLRQTPARQRGIR